MTHMQVHSQPAAQKENKPNNSARQPYTCGTQRRKGAQQQQQPPFVLTVLPLPRPVSSQLPRGGFV